MPDAATLAALGSILSAIAWPMTAIVAGILLRRPLTQAVASLSGRMTKLSIGHLGIDLAPAKEAPPTWKIGDIDLRQPTVSYVIDTSFTSLFAQMSDRTSSDYAVIDLGAGDRWLTSRLFLFAVLLQRMRGLRAFVFVGRTGDVPRKFIAIADPAGVRWTLARRYPHFEQAWGKAYGDSISPPNSSPQIQSETGAMEPFQASTIARNFLQAIQNQAPPPPDEKAWVALPGVVPPLWEHAMWVTVETLESDLGPVLDRESWLTDNPDDSSDERRLAVLRRRGSYTALLTPDGRFASLVDRQAVLEQLAAHFAET